MVLNVIMSHEQRDMWERLLKDLQDKDIAYYAFVDAYNEQFKIQELIDLNLVRRDMTLPKNTDGLNRYFPQYPYRLTGLGKIIKGNPQNIIMEE